MFSVNLAQVEELSRMAVATISVADDAGASPCGERLVKIVTAGYHFDNWRFVSESKVHSNYGNKLTSVFIRLLSAANSD